MKTTPKFVSSEQVIELFSDAHEMVHNRLQGIAFILLAQPGQEGISRWYLGGIPNENKVENYRYLAEALHTSATSIEMLAAQLDARWLN